MLLSVKEYCLRSHASFSVRKGIYDEGFSGLVLRGSCGLIGGVLIAFKGDLGIEELLSRIVR